MKIALTGASGFIGSHIRRHFKNTVVIKRYHTVEDIRKRLSGVDAVINLAGAPIIKRWTESYKDILISSRIRTTKKLVQAINSSNVRHLISTSATGIYPDDVECDESCRNLSQDFLGRLAQDWEREALRCEKLTTILRFGVVLGKEGGALKKMLLPFRLGLGGPIGDGSMVMSWIDIHDLMEMYRFVLERGEGGIFNAVSPNPVTNREFTRELARVLKRPAILPVPRLVLRLLYAQSASVLTASKIVYPRRFLNLGFTFSCPTVEESLRHLLLEG